METRLNHVPEVVPEALLNLLLLAMVIVQYFVVYTIPDGAVVDCGRKEVIELSYDCESYKILDYLDRVHLR